jgi:hypothetical protein
MDAAAGFAHLANNLFDKAPNYKAWPLSFAKTGKIYAKPLPASRAAAPEPHRAPEKAAERPHPERPSSLSAPNTPRAKTDSEKKIADMITHINKITAAIKELSQRIEALERRRG